MYAIAMIVVVDIEKAFNGGSGYQTRYKWDESPDVETF